MTILNRAAVWLSDHGSIVLGCAVLLLATSVSLGAQDRSNARPSNSGDHGRVAAPRSGGDSSAVGSTSSTPPRTAQRAPRDRTPSRQPSARSDRGSRGGGHHHSGHVFSRHYPYWYGGWWGWWGWDPYWAYPTRPYPHRTYRGGGYDAGALDLDVSPARTQVYLDGERVGTVDNFDGWPQYLWLEEGTYDLVLYLDGYKTLARQVTIYPGVVQGMNDELEPGPSTRPEDIPSTSTERRDERLRRERELQAETADADEDWRDRVRRERYRTDEGVRDVRREAGHLRLSIEPADASVYLDGRFVGTADELSSLSAGLLVDPGEHTLSVVRPGHKAVDRELTVDPGEELEVEVELEDSDS
jgi:hypothetical protein